MWMRFAAHADVGYLRGVDQAYYRRHDLNMHKTDFGGQLDELRQLLAAYDAVLEKCGDLLPDRDALADTVHRRLARQALRRAGRAYDRGRTDLGPVGEVGRVASGIWPG